MTKSLFLDATKGRGTPFSVVTVDCRHQQQSLFVPVSFELRAGESLHIRGENGVGKTTLLRSLAGIIKPYSGTINWAGEDVYNNILYKNHLSFLGHKNALKNTLTVSENLLLCASLKQIPNLVAVQQAITKMGLKDKASLMVRQLSAGQKQRLALTKLLLSKSTIWILDEPFTALDQEGINMIGSAIEQHLAAQGIVIYTSHQCLQFSFPAHKELQLVSVA